MGKRFRETEKAMEAKPKHRRGIAVSSSSRVPAETWLLETAFEPLRTCSLPPTENAERIGHKFALRIGPRGRKVIVNSASA